jgi:hypothetical protein
MARVLLLAMVVRVGQPSDEKAVNEEVRVVADRLGRKMERTLAEGSPL